MFGVILFMVILLYVILRVYLTHGRIFTPRFSDKAMVYALEHNMTEDELISTIHSHPELFRPMPPPRCHGGF